MLQFQVAFYMFWCAQEGDVETQKLGIVMILFLFHAYQNFFDQEDNEGISRVLRAMPVRFSGFHICIPDTPLFHAARATALLMLGAQNRLRVRFHVGKFEVQRTLRKIIGSNGM